MANFLLLLTENEKNYIDSKKMPFSFRYEK